MCRLLILFLRCEGLVGWLVYQGVLLVHWQNVNGEYCLANSSTRRVQKPIQGLPRERQIFGIFQNRDLLKTNSRLVTSFFVVAQNSLSSIGMGIPATQAPLLPTTTVLLLWSGEKQKLKKSHFATFSLVLPYRVAGSTLKCPRERPKNSLPVLGNLKTLVHRQLVYYPVVREDVSHSDPVGSPADYAKVEGGVPKVADSVLARARECYYRALLNMALVRLCLLFHAVLLLREQHGNLHGQLSHPALEKIEFQTLSFNKAGKVLETLSLQKRQVRTSLNI